MVWVTVLTRPAEGQVRRAISLAHFLKATLSEMAARRLLCHRHHLTDPTSQIGFDRLPPLGLDVLYGVGSEDQELSKEDEECSRGNGIHYQLHIAFPILGT